MDMQIIDAGIIHGFETLIKICGYIILFSIGGVTRSLFAGQALYTDLQVGDHGTLSYRDGRVVGFTRAA